jgi:hypothetical protein
LISITKNSLCYAVGKFIGAEEVAISTKRKKVIKRNWILPCSVLDPDPLGSVTLGFLVPDHL